MFGNYLKMAWKVLGRRRFFTFVSLFGIGFTLTTLMIVVTLADHVLAPSYPESRRDRTLVLEQISMSGDRSTWVSGPGYKFIATYARDLPGVERLSVYTRPRQAATFRDGRKQTFDIRYTDAEFWRVMDFDFREGAAFTEADDRNAARVAVISESTRRRFFGDRPGVGETIDLDATAYRVVGVVRDVPWHRHDTVADVWLPLHTHRAPGFFDRLLGGCTAAMLLEPGADVRQVQAAFRERLTRVEFPDPERYHTMLGLPMTPLERLAHETLHLEIGQTAPRRFILFSLLAVLGFMLLPAINLVNINLSRIYERSSEIGVRKAFGAAGPHLVLQFVVENVVLCLLGGVIGLAGAFVILRAASLLPQLPFTEFHLNWRIFAAAFLLATVFGLLSGVWPAWKMSRRHPVAALKGGTS